MLEEDRNASKGRKQRECKSCRFPPSKVKSPLLSWLSCATPFPAQTCSFKIRLFFSFYDFMWRIADVLPEGRNMCLMFGCHFLCFPLSYFVLLNISLFLCFTFLTFNLHLCLLCSFSVFFGKTWIYINRPRAQLN